MPFYLFSLTLAWNFSHFLCGEWRIEIYLKNYYIYLLCSFEIQYRMWSCCETLLRPYYSCWSTSRRPPWCFLQTLRFLLSCYRHTTLVFFFFLPNFSFLMCKIQEVTFCIILLFIFDINDQSLEIGLLKPTWKWNEEGFFRKEGDQSPSSVENLLAIFLS